MGKKTSSVTAASKGATVQGSEKQGRPGDVASGALKGGLTGAATGAVAGPTGAIVGGVIGAGVGAAIEVPIVNQWLWGPPRE